MTSNSSGDWLRAYLGARRAKKAEFAGERVFGYPGAAEALAEAVADYEASGDLERDEMADAESMLGQAVADSDNDEGTGDGYQDSADR